jgi:hypothetical protein
MRSPKTIIQWALFVGVLLSAIVAGRTSAQAPCLTVDVAGTVVFPDGTEHSGGQLSLCDWKAYTPIARLHQSYVDGRPVQMLLGTRSTNERNISNPDEVFFRPDAAGRLELLGYARTFAGRSVTVSFQRQKPSTNVNRLARAREQKDDLLIVMARPH